MKKKNKNILIEVVLGFLLFGGLMWYYTGLVPALIICFFWVIIVGLVQKLAWLEKTMSLMYENQGELIKLLEGIIGECIEEGAGKAGGG